MQCGYIGFYSGKQIEIYADNLYDAKMKAIAAFKVKKKNENMVAVVLAEKDGEPVEHTPDF